jgi:hypothetical protein
MAAWLASISRRMKYISISRRRRLAINESGCQRNGGENISNVKAAGVSAYQLCMYVYVCICPPTASG